MHNISSMLFPALVRLFIHGEIIWVLQAFIYFKKKCCLEKTRPGEEKEAGIGQFGFQTNLENILSL